MAAEKIRKKEKNAYRKDILRNIRNGRKRFIAIAVITLLGVMMFSGLQASCMDLRRSADRFFDAQNLHDLSVVSTLGLTDDDVTALQNVSGVKTAEGIYSEKINTDIGGGAMSVQIETLSSSGIDAPYLVEGRLPEKADEAVVTQKFIQDSGLSIGDSFSLAEDENTATEDSTGNSSADGTKGEEAGTAAENSAGSDTENSAGSDAAANGTAEKSSETVAGETTEKTGSSESAAETKTSSDNVNDSNASDSGEAEEEAEESGKTTDNGSSDSADSDNTIDINTDLDTDVDVSTDIDVDTDSTAGAKYLVSDFTIVGVCVDPTDVDNPFSAVSYRTDSSAADKAYIRADAIDSDYFTAVHLVLTGASDLECYSDDYENMVAAVRSDIEDHIKSGREAARTSSVKSEAQTKLDDAKSEADEKLADAEKKLEDGQTELNDQLSDAKKKLEDGEAELSDGKSQIEDGKKQISDAKSQLDEAQSQLDAQKAQAQQQIADGRAQITSGKEQLNQQIAAFQNQISALQAALGGENNSDSDSIASEGSSEAEGTGSESANNAAGNAAAASGLDASTIAEYQQEIATDQAVLAQLQQQLASLEQQEAALDQQEQQANQQIAEGQAEIDANRKTLEENEAELESNEKKLEDSEADLKQGWEDYNSGKEEGEQKLSDGWEKYNSGKREAGEKIADAQKEIDDIKAAQWYVQDRTSLSGYSNISSDADSIEAIGTVFPIVFFAVAVLISLTTVARMVDEDRGLIGTYKSLGFTDGEIRSKYLIYSLLACAAGSAAGTVMAFIGLPTFIFTVFQVMYLLPSYYRSFLPSYGVTGPVLFTAGVLFATWAACRKELRETPASLMRPKSPRAGSRVLLEKITPVWSRMSFLNKVTARNLFRYKGRLFMTIFGIGGCMALLLFGFAIKDSVTDLEPRQYEQTSLYDVMAVATADDNEKLLSYVGAESSGEHAGETSKENSAKTSEENSEGTDPETTAESDQGLSEETSLKETSSEETLSKGTSSIETSSDPQVEDFINVELTSVKLKTSDDGGVTAQLIVVPEGVDLSSYVNLAAVHPDGDTDSEHNSGHKNTSDALVLQDGAIYVTQNAGEVLGFSDGDTIRMQLPDLQESTIPVTALVKNYLSNYVYMTQATYETYYDSFEPNAVLMHLSDACADQTAYADALAKKEGIVSCVSIEKLRDQFYGSFQLINMVVYIVIMMSAALAFVVLFTLSTTNISERVRELATIKVLGFYDHEVHAYVNKETFILTLIGIVIGIPLGRAFAQTLTVILKLPSIYLAVSLHGISYLYATLLTVAFAFIVSLMTDRTLNQIDPATALKSVE